MRRPVSAFFSRLKIIGASRLNDLSKAVGDVEIDEVVATAAIASTLDQDSALRRKLRRYADCPDDQPLNLELPVGSAACNSSPVEASTPCGLAEAQAMANFDTLDLAEPRPPAHDRAGAPKDRPRASGPRSCRSSFRGLSHHARSSSGSNAGRLLSKYPPIVSVPVRSANSIPGAPPRSPKRRKTSRTERRSLRNTTP